MMCSTIFTCILAISLGAARTVPPSASVASVASHTPDATPPDVDVGMDHPLRVVIGFDPSAAGTPRDLALVQDLRTASEHARAPVVRLVATVEGVGTADQVCRREREADLVVLIGYEAKRDDPIVLAHDCNHNVALASRSHEAATVPELFATLRAEGERAPVRGQRRHLSPKTAKTIAISTVAAVVLAGAIAAIVLGALRKETTVIRFGG